ncbi:hypothetical protein QC761_306790 [Podospora bellae-mahoneyi]|uniref:Rpb7-binding protein n=1 Tax=Podospora bellae-mahoneyi TaxID=2093777 RepID=A0ABR0FNK5_9PEZI|nr:hypothetical protein QC761_306790 [Podospora bellae-mahoneyi]
MASSPVAELEAGLQALLSLKAPGVSGSRISNLTALCVNNPQSESVIVQKFYTHLKKTPGTHKLGVLYVVDQVAREWLKKAKALGQFPINSSAQDGTYAAGVHRLTELMPTLMNDSISAAPEDQKDKIKKLLDIWEKGETFPAAMVSSWREKLNAPQPTLQSTTPPGSPPPNLMASLGIGSKPPAPPATQSNPLNILETLANLARQNAPSTQSNHSAGPVPAPAPPAAPVQAPVQAPAPTAAPAPAPLPAASYGILGSQPGNNAMQPAAPPVNMSTLPHAFPPPMAAPQPAHFPPPAASPVLNGAANPAANPAAVQLLSALLAQGVPVEQIASVMQLMTQNTAATGSPAVPQTGFPQPPQAAYPGYPAPPVSAGPGPAPWEAPRHGADSRDRNGYHSPGRVPRGRSRSRSPGRWDARDSPRSRRNDRGGFDYNRPASPNRGYNDDRGYRQRSPQGRRGSPSDNFSRQQQQQQQGPPQPNGEKWVDHDPTVPPGHFKVLSRTLFVGGVMVSEPELREIFSRFGEVQSAIVHKEKRHAFVKMYYRKDAEKAKAAMSEGGARGNELRTKWGVGFGPRDCSDYGTGISVIPIQKLTEADRKWVLTAPYGGSGGRPIVTGMVVEEPDIEIGAGVSSKAISRRMQTDKGGSHGPKSSRREEDHHHDGGYQGGGGGGGGRGGWGGGKKDRGGRGGGFDGKRGSHGGNGNQQNGDDPIVMELPPGIQMSRNGPVFQGFSGGY